MENPAAGAPRTIAAMLLASVLTVFWTHGLGAITSHFSEASSIAAWPVTIVAILCAVTTTWVGLKRGARNGAIAGAVLAATGVFVVNIGAPGEWSRALPLVLLLPCTAFFSRWLAVKIPASFDAEATKTKARAAALAVLALATLTQTARLTSYMADVEKGFYVMSRNDKPHECIGGYLYAAELNMRGEENIYNNDLYAGWNRRAVTDSEIKNIPAPDAYYYPPQFLLLPRAAVSLTKDIAVLRLMWLATQATLVISVALSLAAWIGGRAGGYAATLFPLVFISVPSIHALHFGQFHFATIALAVGGLLALAKGRKFLGAGMLGFAIVAKIFPIVLLVGLAIKKKWTELAYTAGAIVLLTGIAYIIVGEQTFRMFFADMLPRLSDGSVATFKINEPDRIGIYITGNQGFFGMIRKLVALDVTTISFASAVTTAKWISLAAILAALIGYSRKAETNEDRAIGWIALIGVASISGTIALGWYVPVTLLWLASLLALRTKTNRTIRILVVLCWLTMFFPFTGEPIFGFVRYPLFTWLSLFAALVMATTFLVSLYQRAGQPATDTQ